MMLTKCNKASVYKTGDMEENPICEVIVKLNSSDKDVTIVVEDEYADRLVDEVYVSFYDMTSGLINCRCKLSDPEVNRIGANRYGFYTCTILEQISVVERRKEVKVSATCFVDVKVPYPQVVPEGFEDIEPEDGYLITEGIMQDISAGGVAFRSSFPLYVGSVVDLDLFLEDDKVISVKAEILRSEKLNPFDAMSICYYGCRFIDASEEIKDELRAYIHNEMIRQKRI